jgi:hypothetical protein
MKNILILAGAAVLAASAAAPAAAKPGNGHGSHASMGYGTGNCPPGLAKKHNGCLPPGQARKRYDIGQRLPYGYNGYTPYDQIPYDVRSQYDLDPYGRYIYDQNYVYGVDPRTNAITRILSAILR